MAAIFGFLGPFLLYWLILFVACFAVVEYGQNYLYDETTPGAGLKVGAGSAVLALLLMWTRTEFHTMFTADLARTVILAIVAFAIFTLAFQFQPWHALPIGVITVLLMSGTGTMAVQSFANRGRPIPSAVQRTSKPIRRSTPIAPMPKASEAPKAPADTKAK